MVPALLGVEPEGQFSQVSKGSTGSNGVPSAGHIAQQDVASPLFHLPAAQGVHEALPLAEEYVPLGQDVQLVAPCAENCPAVQSSHTLSPFPLQEPAGQGTQVPLPVGREPATQEQEVDPAVLEVPPTQDVQEELPLMEAENVPLGQRVQAPAPAAENVPLAHG